MWQTLMGISRYFKYEQSLRTRYINYITYAKVIND